MRYSQFSKFQFIYMSSNRGSQIPESLLTFTPTRPLKVRISQGLGPFSETDILTTGRKKAGSLAGNISKSQAMPNGS